MAKTTRTANRLLKKIKKIFPDTELHLINDMDTHTEYEFNIGGNFRDTTVCGGGLPIRATIALLGKINDISADYEDVYVFLNDEPPALLLVFKEHPSDDDCDESDR